MAIQAWHIAYRQPMTESLDVLDVDGHAGAGLMELNKIAVDNYRNEKDTGSNVVQLAISRMKSPFQEEADLECQRWITNSIQEMEFNIHGRPEEID
jgi:hypothetical protein